MPESKTYTQWGYTIGDFAETLQEELKPILVNDPDLDHDIPADLNRLIRALEDLSSKLQDI